MPECDARSFPSWRCWCRRRSRPRSRRRGRRALRQEREEKAQQHRRRTRQAGSSAGCCGSRTTACLERLLNPAEGHLSRRSATSRPAVDSSLGPAYRKPGLFGGHADFSTFAIGSFSRYWMLDARLSHAAPGEWRGVRGRLRPALRFPERGLLRHRTRTRGATTRRSSARQHDRRRLAAASRPAPWLSFGGAHRSPVAPARGGARRRLSIETRVRPAADRRARSQPTDFLRYERLRRPELSRAARQPAPGRAVRAQLRAVRRPRRRPLRLQAARGRRPAVHPVLERPARARAARPRVVVGCRGRAAGALLSSADARRPRRSARLPALRFRDDNLLLLQAEYRWEIFTALDGAIFYDAGKVAPHPRRPDARATSSPTTASVSASAPSTASSSASRVRSAAAAASTSC